MIHLNYKTKKELKSEVGNRLRFTETAMFGPEYKDNGDVTGANPAHSWYATVTMRDGKIAKVS